MRKGRRRYHERLTFSRTQVFLVLGSIAAIAVLSFSLGHLVTRETAPSPEDMARLESPALPESEVLEEMERLEQRLREVETESAASPEEKTEPAGQPADKEQTESEKSGRGEKVDLSFTERLGGDMPAGGGPAVRVKTLEKIERVFPAPLDKKVDVKAYKPIVRTGSLKAASAEPAGEEEQPGTGTVKEPEPPPAQKTKKPKAAPTVAELRLRQKPAIPKNPQYTIQVGSFPSEIEALALRKKLEQKGYHTYIKKLVRSRSVWYRVRVGAYVKEWEAKRSLNALRQKEGLEGIILDYEKP